MQCTFCGGEIQVGEAQCSRCGGAVYQAPQASQPPPQASQPPPQASQPPPQASQPPHDQSLTGTSQVSPFGEPAQPPQNQYDQNYDVASQSQIPAYPTPPQTGDYILSSADRAMNNPETALEAVAHGPASADPEAELQTGFISLQDRQADISTRIVELPAAAKSPEPVDKKGLPESRVSRSIEDSIIEIKRHIYRFGKIGRAAFFSHIAVILGVVSPWLYVRFEGYTPGLDLLYGIAALVLSLASIGMLVWRHQRKTGMKVLPIALHLLLSAAIVVVVFYQYRLNSELPEHSRPELAFGFYMSIFGGLGAFLAALGKLKDLR